MSNKKKMEVLYFVEQYIKRYGYPPTVRDIGKGLGYRSPSTVHGYLRQLKEEHLIESDGSKLILSILVYTFFSRMFDLMLPPVAKHSIVVA